MIAGRRQGRVVPITDERWSRFVAGHQEATPFHHPAWAQVIAECYGFRPFALLLGGEAGDVGLPVIAVRHGPARRKWVSLPFTDHCQPLGAVQPDVVAVLDAMRGAAGVGRFEIRGQLEGTAAHPGNTSFGHTLALGADSEEVFAGLHRNQVQRNIRRAQREGVRVHTSTAQHDLTRVFFDLHVMTRRRLGVPVQSQRYFRVLWRRMIRGGLGFTAIASIGDTPVAAAVFLTFNGTIVYKYGASDPGYWKMRANHLLFWEAIRWGCEHGFHTFDFGRTGLGDETLRQFKLRWGTVERLLDTTVIADRAPASARDEVPELARAIIRRAPAVVTRAVGSALYRFTA